MTYCEEVRGSAAGLSALSHDDPERVRAMAHAKACAGCAAALAEGSRLLALLDAIPPPPAPTEETLLRISSRILDEAFAEREGAAKPVRRISTSKRRFPLAVPAATAAAWTLGVLLARHRAPDAELWLESAGAGLLAAGLTFVLPVSRVAVTAIAILSGIGSLLAGADGELAARVGMHCAFVEGMTALAPLMATAYLSLRRGLPASPLLYAGAAAGGALAGQAALHLACPARTAPHLLAFHTGAVLLTALLGATLSYLPPLRTAH